MIKIKFLIIISILIQLNINVKSENKVFLLYKINNEIITNIDVENEKNYLLALNSQLKTLNNQQLFSIAKDSIIKEQIKKFELNKYFKLGEKNSSLKNIVIQLYKKIGFNSDEEFQNHLKKYNLNIDDISKKIEIESTWNQLIYSKFRDRVLIDKKKLIKKIKDKKIDNKSYQLAEIIFKNKKGTSQKKNIENIEESIKEIGFGNTANIYSIADTNKIAGKIGWVDEKLLSEKMISNIKVLKTGEHTRPINIGANSIILKIEDIRINKVVVDQKEELQKLITFETNKQLDKFSLIHFNRIKLDAIINEY